MSKVLSEKDMQQVTTGQRIGQVAAKTGTYIFLVIMALIVLFPFYWMIISSLKELNEYNQTQPTLWPRKLDFMNYSEAITVANLGMLWHSFKSCVQIITGCSVDICRADFAVHLILKLIEKRRFF